MDSRVDHKGRSIEHSVGATINDFSSMIDLDQIRCLDQRKGCSEGIHPEGGWVDGITQGNVASNTCKIRRTLYEIRVL